MEKFLGSSTAGVGAGVDGRYGCFAKGIVQFGSLKQLDSLSPCITVSSDNVKRSMHHVTAVRAFGCIDILLCFAGIDALPWLLKRGFPTCWPTS